MTTLASDALPSDKIAIAARFEVELGGALVATFSECSGMTVTVATQKVEEGGANHTTYKLPGRADFSNIVLKRGITKSTELMDWLKDVLNGKRVRYNVSVHVYNWEAGGGGLTRMTTWQFLNAFPVKWTGPTLQTSSNAIALETLELAHDGFVEV